MCKPNVDRGVFFAKGFAKGWSDSRIQAAWDALKFQTAREDARTLASAPPPILAGDRVMLVARQQLGTVLAVDGDRAWVKWANGERLTCARANLARAA